METFYAEKNLPSMHAAPLRQTNAYRTLRGNNNRTTQRISPPEYQNVGFMLPTQDRVAKPCGLFVKIHIR